MSNSIRFSNSNQNFVKTLRSRVDEFFDSENISKYGNYEMASIAAFLILGYIICYTLILSNSLPLLYTLLICGLFGFFNAQIGLNIGHDAVHGSISSNKKINTAGRVLFNLVGANDYMWSISHNFFHHNYTNISEADDDINQPSILRVDPNKKKLWIHKYQHFYFPFLYMFASLSWVFIKDFSKFFNKKLRINPKKAHPTKELYRLFLYKLAYYSIIIFIPLVFTSYTWYQVLLGVLVMHVIEGLTLALVFHLAHLVEEAQFPILNSDGNIETNWFIHQLSTTANFSRKSWLAHVFCGGLNFQVEHHLFPNICHVHYRKISPIIKKTTYEFNLPYLDSGSFVNALYSHFKFLKKMGENNH